MWTAPTIQVINQSVRLLISGDIESNPGPTNCSVCEKTVRRNAKFVTCSQCKTNAHLSCVGKVTQTWLCQPCILTLLPYRGIKDLDETQTIGAPCIQAECKHLRNLESNGTSIAHLNTQSITSTFAEFEMMLSTYRFDIITLSETWLKDNKMLLDHVKISGYRFEYLNRQIKRGGGVGCYIKEHFEYKVRDDIYRKETTIEHLWLEIKAKAKGNSYLLGIFYQPSSVDADKIAWIEKLDTLLSQVTTNWHGPIILTGDTNINVKKESNTSGKYLRVLEHHGLEQHIAKPTRKESGLIDHISSNLKKIIATDVIYTDEISDHDCPYVIFNIRKQKFEPRLKLIRNEKNFDINEFLNDVQTLPFATVYALENPSDKLDIFNELLLTCLNNHAPLVCQRITRPPAPWLKNFNIKEKLAEKELLRTTAQKSGDDSDKSKYRKCRNEVKRSIKSAKWNFYKSALSSKRPKEVWNTIHRILHPNPVKINANPEEINLHFNTTAERLLGSQSKTENQLKDTIDSLDHNDTMFNFRAVTYEDVRKAILSLRKDCSTGHDTLPAKYIKLCVDYITSPVCHIINECIRLCHFPDKWKISRISPVPKVNCPKDPSDFRPISILPILSKVYEKLLMQQIVTYLESQMTLSDHQSGFRKGHCTVSTCIKIRDDILKAMDRGEITLSIMADYSKAFDTVDYETMLLKLHKIGFSKDAKLLVCSYLSNRKQYVQIDCNCSKHLTVTHGVPQGSILGPVLFNIYVHDLSENTNGSCMQYADDTSIYESFKPKEMNQYVERINEDLNKIVEWSSSSNLIFNTGKTKTVLFASRQLAKAHNLSDPSLYEIKSMGKKIERTNNYKILGMIFNQDLSWNLHINQVLSNTYSCLRMLSKIKRFTPYYVRKQLAETLVLSRIDYGNAVYHSAPAYLLNRLQRVINASAGYVRRSYSNDNDIIKMRWLPIIERLEFSIAKLAWKSINSSDWPKFLPMQKNPQTRTRRGQLKDTIRCSTNIQTTFEYTASKIFNDLPTDCRSCDDYHMFCKMAKKYFLDKALARNLSHT